MIRKAPQPPSPSAPFASPPALGSSSAKGSVAPEARGSIKVQFQQEQSTRPERHGAVYPRESISEEKRIKREEEQSGAGARQPPRQPPRQPQAPPRQPQALGANSSSSSSAATSGATSAGFRPAGPPAPAPAYPPVRLTPRGSSDRGMAGAAYDAVRLTPRRFADTPAAVDPTFDVEGGLQPVEGPQLFMNSRLQLVNRHGQRVDSHGRITRARGTQGGGSRTRFNNRQYRW